MTAESVLARTFADGSQDQATGTFGGTVTGLVVAGAAVSVQPGGQFEIPGIGYGAVNERRILRSDGAYRSSEVALHIHLSSGWHNLPAGTEILLGYAAAAATGHETVVRLSPGGPATPVTTAPGDRGGEASSDPSKLDARSSPCLRATARRRTRATASRRRASRRRRPGASRSPRRSIRRGRRSSPRPGTSSRSPAARTTVTTSATSAATRASTRAAICLRPRARRSSRCSPASSTTWAGTASAAGGCGSRT